jgi:hypothetical protein
MVKKSKAKEPVFCQRCRFLYDKIQCDYIDNRCNNWYKKNNGRKKLPKEINQDNNCEWFEEV